MVELTDDEKNGAEKSLGYLSYSCWCRLPRCMRAVFDLDDLRQEGLMVMLQAEESFDRSKGVKFATYFSRMLSNYYIDLIAKNSSQKRGGKVAAVPSEEVDVPVEEKYEQVDVKIDLEKAKQSVSNCGRKIIEFVLGEGSSYSGGRSLEKELGMSYYEIEQGVKEVRAQLS